MPQQQSDSDFESKAQQLTIKAEHHQKVSDELNTMPFQERLDMARHMESINGEHRAADPSLPELKLTIEKDAGGQQHLTDMQAVTHRTLWFDKKDDVYDLPPKVEHNVLDYIADTRLTRDIEDSRRLGDGGDNYLK